MLLVLLQICVTGTWVSINKLWLYLWYEMERNPFQKVRWSFNVDGKTWNWIFLYVHMYLFVIKCSRAIMKLHLPKLDTSFPCWVITCNCVRSIELPGLLCSLGDILSKLHCFFHHCNESKWSMNLVIFHHLGWIPSCFYIKFCSVNKWMQMCSLGKN